MTRIRSVLPGVAAVALLCAFLLQGLAFLRTNSQTFDEAVHLAAGYSYLATGDFRLNAGHPPLSKQLAALPLYLLERPKFEPDPAHWRDAAEFKVGRDFLYGGVARHERALRVSRVPNLILGASLVGLVGWWARRLWGTGAGLVAMALAAFDPNLIAHSSVITPDLGTSLFFFLSCYLCWEYARSRSGRLLLALGVSTGCALACKHTALVLPLALALLLVGAPPPQIGARGSSRLPARIGSAARPLLGILVVAVATLSLFYFVHGLPAYVTGFVSHFQRPGAPAFLLGEVSSEGWWLYFPVAFLLKTPDGTLLMLVLSLLLSGYGRRLEPRHWLFLALPPALYFLAMMVGRVNIGIRYVLPVYPFLFVLCSRLATVGAGGGSRRLLASTATVLLPLALAVGSSLRVAPHQLAYFNLVSGGPERGVSLLGDSNLDWGQDLANLRDFLRRERVPVVYLSYFGTAPPARYGLRYQYLPGFFDPLQEPARDLLPDGSGKEWLAISVSNLQGIFLADRELYAWLREAAPIARIGYTIHVYDLTGDAGAHRQLAAVYRSAGLERYAEREEWRATAARPRRAPSEAAE